jgi:hypothetical protein
MTIDQARTETLTARDYADAISVQDACNLSGVVFSFARVMQRICNSTHGTSERNQHAIARLYAEQIYHLTRGYDHATYADAYGVCEVMQQS